MLDIIKTTLIAIWTAWLGFIGALSTQTTNEPSPTETPATGAIIEEYQAPLEQGLAGLPMPTETPTAITQTLTKDDLIAYKIATTTAQNIEDYFNKKKAFLSAGVGGEYDQWIKVFNQAKQEQGIISISSFKDKNELVSKMNGIIHNGALSKTK